MNFELTEQEKTFRDFVWEFASKELLPGAADRDVRNEFPMEITLKMGETGLFGVSVPQEYDGLGLTAVCQAMAMEQVARADAAAASILGAQYLGMDCILLYGSEYLKQTYLRPAARGEKIAAFSLTEPDAGSDVSSIQTTARREGDYYRINGRKVFCSNGGAADFVVVFAKTGTGREGISALVVERGYPGFQPGRMDDKMGIRAATTWELIFDDCRVPAANLVGEEGQGFQIAMDVLDRGRVDVAAMAVGISQAAFDAALEYAQVRHQFGRPIAKFQGIQDFLAEMAVDLLTARLLTYYAASRRDAGLPFSKEASMAKLFASEAAFRITDKAVQVHGGYGYIRGFPVERYFRDARILRLFEGTSEIQKRVIAQHLLRGQ